MPFAVIMTQYVKREPLVRCYEGFGEHSLPRSRLLMSRNVPQKNFFGGERCVISKKRGRLGEQGVVLN